jgi:hypothetical protein
VTLEQHVPEEWRRQWVAALDALELDVQTTAALLANEHRSRELPVPERWLPPTNLGPLPRDLRPRADAILGRQIAVAEVLTRTLASNRRQAALATRMQSNAGPVPAYIDTAA